MATHAPPGRELMNQVRTGFILQNTTLTAWCRNNNVHISKARQTLYGTWDGPKARELRSQIVKAARMRAVA